MIVIADSSGLISALNSSDPEHSEVARALNSAGYVIISPLALAEVDYVVTSRVNRRAADQVLNLIRVRVQDGRASLADIDAEILGTALAIRRRYAKLRLDLADAVNVALAARYHTDAILTLDRRDFRALRPLTEHAVFRLLPEDVA